MAIFQRNVEGEYTILLGKRKRHPGKGRWSIPGGGAEACDADLAATARREFWEESGLDLKFKK